MWQRFTERARRIILLAQEEAGRMNSGHVGTEHLLLGLVRENEGVSAQVLYKMGVSLPEVRRQIDLQTPPGSGAGSSEPKLTPKAKRVLELAADEARRMRHNYIGTEHLLLALLREKDGLAARTLHQLGANLEVTRKHVLEYLGPSAPPFASIPDDFEAPDDLPVARGQSPSVYSALLALLDDPDSPEVQILLSCGLDLEAARQRLQARIDEATG